MIIYRTKFIINGYKLGAEFGGKDFIAVPQKLISKDDVKVVCGEITKVIKKNSEPQTTLDFKDKFNREKMYTLCYFPLNE